MCLVVPAIIAQHQGLELREYYAAACGHCQAHVFPMPELTSLLATEGHRSQCLYVFFGEAMAPAWKAAQSAYSGPVTFRGSDCQG